MKGSLNCSPCEHTASPFVATFLATNLLVTLNNNRLNLHTNPYNISVTQQRFSLVSLGYLCFDRSSLAPTSF